MFPIILWQVSIEGKARKIDLIKNMERDQDIESITLEDSGSPKEGGANAKAKEHISDKEDINGKYKDDGTNDDDGKNDKGNDAVENSDEDEDDKSDEHSENEEQEKEEDIYPRIMIHTCDVHSQVANQQFTFKNGQNDQDFLIPFF